MTRRTWVVVVGAIALVGALVIAFLVGRGHTNTAAPANPTAPATSAAVSPSPSPSAEALPRGCVGGADRTAAAVTKAQADAQHTEVGAAEVAATAFRTLYQWPAITPEDARTLGAQLIATDAPAGFHDLETARKTYPATGLPKNQPFTVAFTPGAWSIEDGSTSDRVTVTVGAAYVLDGAVSPTQRAAVTYVMAWEDDRWKIANARMDRTPESVYEVGQAYTGGC